MITNAMPIDIDTLRSLLIYEPATGKLYWKARDVSLFNDGIKKTAAQICRWWNGRFAGTEAFTAAGVEGSRCGHIFSKGYYAHVVAWALYYGAWPEDDIDHEDHDRSNNRPGNLRIAGHQVNMQNKLLYRTNKSGSHGVVWHRRVGRWQAYITVFKKRRHLGYFDDLDAAVAARKAAEDGAGCFHANHGGTRSVGGT